MVAVFASCNTETLTPDNPGDKYSFKAFFVSVNRTILDGLNVKWAEEDLLLISDGTTQSKFQAFPSETDARQAGLGLCDEETPLADVDAYYAVYPASYGASTDYREKGFLNSAASGTWGAYLPTSHTAASGTFPKGTFPMIGLGGSDKTFSFRNVASVVKIIPTCNVANVRIQSMVLKANENITGTLSVAYNGTSDPVTTITTGAKNINYRAKNGSNTCTYEEALKCGDPCYFSIAPGTFTGIELTVNYIKENGSTGSQKFSPSGSKTFVRNQINTIEVELNFEDNGLSAGGCAKCDVIKAAGEYRFLANVGGNGVALTGPGAMETAIDPASIKGVKVIWDDNNIINGTPVLDGNFIKFKTPAVFAAGNALIGAYSTEGCTAGTCIWSWHIWASDVTSGVPAAEKGKCTVEWMTYNLGGTSVDTGLYYQWGRKDPFTPARSEANLAKNQADVTVALAAANPEKFYTNTATKNWCSTTDTAYDTKDFWNKSRTSEAAPSSSGVTSATPNLKTMFDPCPVGYRVPSHQEIKEWVYSANSDYEKPYYVKGDFKLNATFYWIGAEGKLYSANANRVAYWTNDPVSGYANNASAVLWAKSDGAQTTLHPTGTTQSEAHGIMRHLGNVIRCCKE